METYSSILVPNIVIELVTLFIRLLEGFILSLLPKVPRFD
jgi:hypothetical protein